METAIIIVAVIAAATIFAGLCEGLRKLDKNGEIKEVGEKLF